VTPTARAALNELFVRLADGDRAAIAPAFAALWPVVRAFTTAALDDPGRGDDAAQQALIKLFAQASAFDARRDALSWAIAIAAFEVRTLRRRAQRRREAPLTSGVHADLRAATTPESELIDRELQRAARAALAGLGPADVATITAALADRRPPSDATFRKRLQRALGRLRETWRSKHDVP
jgi:RNA polymerase sigma-70 factor (ECF subfamily)